MCCDASNEKLRKPPACHTTVISLARHTSEDGGGGMGREGDDNSSHENIKLITTGIPDVFLHLQTRKRLLGGWGWGGCNKMYARQKRRR